jgi:hypothetical protein
LVLLTGYAINDVYIGNGAHPILLAMQVSINEGDEVLVPLPDYPFDNVGGAAGGSLSITQDEAPTGTLIWLILRAKSPPNAGHRGDQSQQPNQAV